VDRFKASVNALADKCGDYSDLIRQDVRIACTWADPSTFQLTSWHRFQEAVKAHYAETWTALQDTGLVTISA